MPILNFDMNGWLVDDSRGTTQKIVIQVDPTKPTT